MPTSEQFVVAAFVAAVILFVVVLGRLRRGAREQRDPQRVFTAAQRQAMFRRAGGQCEHKRMILPRCTAAPTHADHIFPWSRGGATVLSNGQALCARHNLAKSNKVPSSFYIWRLESRRRRYFDDPREVRVEYRLGVAPMARY